MGSRRAGFTLLEILIAVAILAVISSMTAVSIQHSIKVKAKMEQDIEEFAALRDALSLMSHDIALAFHWVDVNEAVKKKLTAEAQATGKQPPFPVNPNPAAQPTPSEDLTAFIGDKESVYFTTLSHERTITNSQESDQAKVGYYLKSVRSSKNRDATTKALMRSESPVLDDDVTKPGKEARLLENVKEFKIQYLGGDDKEWQESWKSNEKGDAKMGNHFPDAVQITLTTGTGDKELKLETMISVHMPNNDPFKAATPAPGTGTQGGGGNPQ